MLEPRSQLSSTNGPVPIGFLPNSCAFSASVSPGIASNAAFGMIAVLNTLSAGRIVGSGYLSLISIVCASGAVTVSIDATMKFQMPLSGFLARFSDQITSSAVIGVPSENLTPSRSFSVTTSPASFRLHSVASPGLSVMPSSLDMIRVS